MRGGRCTGRREAGAAACKEMGEEGVWRGDAELGVGNVHWPGGAEMSWSRSPVWSRQCCPRQLPRCPQPPPCGGQVPFPAPAGTGLQERFNNQHWPPGRILPSSPGTKTEGGTRGTSTGPEEAPRRNREWHWALKRWLLRQTLPHLQRSTYEQQPPRPSRAHRAGLGGANKQVSPGYTHRHPAGGAVQRLLSTPTGGLR